MAKVRLKALEETDDTAAQDEARQTRLAQLALSIVEKRAAAIEARKASGIEEEWNEDLEHYNGIDDANRKEFSAWRTKPPGQIQPQASGSTRSTVFINITAPYVDIAAASMSDMLLPTDDRAWSIQPTPVPELVDLIKGKVPRSMKLALAQLYPNGPLPDEEAQQAGIPANPDDWVKQQVAEAKDISEYATACAAKAQKRIEDWHVECQYHKVVREAITDAAKIGTLIVKGPVPVKQKGVMFKDGALIIEQKITPATVLVSPWNFFPDANCGEDIHSGSHTFERDELTARGLMELDGMPGYISSEIQECIKEGPHKAVVNPKRALQEYLTKAADGKYEIWYYHGYLDRQDMEACGLEIEGEMMTIPALITMVNNRIIRASLNPLDSGDFPYDVMPWSKRAGHWAGIGVSRQIRTPQKMVNAGWRSLMDNAGIASGPMLIFRQGMVTPADGVAELRPRKVWLLAEDADAKIEAEKAIGTIKVDMMVNELMDIIHEAMKLAEIVTGLPMLLQGQQGRAPDTLGGMQMLNNNSSVVRRRIAKNFDDYVTEPHVRRYYRWLLQYGEDDSEKGDFVVDARGSSALVQRELANQSIAQILQLAENPDVARRFKIDPARAFAENCKSQHIDPKRIQYTEEEYAGLPPDAPPAAIQVAQIKAEDADKDRQLKLVIQHSTEYIEQMKQQGASAETVASLQAMLTATAAKLRTQVALSQQVTQQADDHHLADKQVEIFKHTHPVPVLPPPVQVPGKAANGHAFDQSQSQP